MEQNTHDLALRLAEAVLATGKQYSTLMERESKIAEAQRIARDFQRAAGVNK